MIITSKQNDYVKYWVNLSDKKFRDKEKRFLIEGDHLIDIARKEGLVLYTISVVDRNADYFVTKEIMEKISNQKSISYNAAVAKFIHEDSIDGNVLILDGIQDPGNLGTMIRSACAFNFGTIILGDTCVDLYNPKTIRATEGLVFKVNVLRRNLKEFIPTLKTIGYEIIGTDVTGGIDIRDVRKDNIGVVIGNEGNGVSEEVKKMCEKFVNISMNGDVESLNAGVAASIIMYEVNHD